LGDKTTAPNPTKYLHYYMALALFHSIILSYPPLSTNKQSYRNACRAFFLELLIYLEMSSFFGA
jgi:hypothetical protein